MQETMTVSLLPGANCPPSKKTQRVLDEHARLAVDHYKRFCDDENFDHDKYNYEYYCEDRRRQLVEIAKEEASDVQGRDLLGRGCNCCKQNTPACGKWCQVLNCRRRLEEENLGNGTRALSL